MFHLLRQANNFRNIGFMMRWMGTVKKFHLPDLGEKIKEGTVKKWYVKEGDVVQEFQKIADIASDKQFTELTSTDTGKIHKILHPEESICQVGELLLEIELQDGKEASPTKAPGKEHSSPKVEAKREEKVQCASPASKEKDIEATPAVRHLVKQHRLNINDIVGTGKNGRISKEDVLNFIEKKQSPPKAHKPDQAKKIQKDEFVHKPAPVVTQFSKNTVHMTIFQKGMQKTMTESNTIPQLQLHEEADITDLFKLRQSIKKSTGKSLTFMSFFIKFFSKALSDFPILNSLYDPSKPFEYTNVQNHNITIAIDSANGLVVPNIKNVQNLSLFEIQAQILRLRGLAESGKLSRSDMENGTICISNIGAVGAGIYAGPLIFPPQVCIVAIGSTQTLPRYAHHDHERLIPRKIMPISFSCDHRVVDGGTIAKFALKWKSYLQNPSVMLATMK